MNPVYYFQLAFSDAHEKDWGLRLNYSEHLSPVYFFQVAFSDAHEKDWGLRLKFYENWDLLIFS